MYLLAEGRLVNLGAADGHPAEIMDMTFALQALGLRYVSENYENLGKNVVNVPYDIDQQVAAINLKA